MNKIHRVIWSAVRQTWVAASEISRSHGKSSTRKGVVGSIATTLIAALPLHAHAAPPAPDALPTGGQVVAGQASVTQSGNQMTVNQTTNKAILNWNTFNIGANAAVTFQQPSSSAVALNRVIGADPSAIYGKLNANGQVFLINPNGVLFGQGARVDVGGLVASTLNISNADFLAGNNRFTRDGSTGSVVNQGELIGKYIALLAPEVRNEGVIAAHQGTVALAAGEAVTLGITGNSLIDVQVDRASINTLVENKQMIQADAGTVIMSAQSASQLLGQVVNSGTVEANGITADGGVIRLRASSNIANTGSLSADAGANGKGGSITVIADLTNPNSLTTVDGTLSAKGGSSSGDGGFIETSGSHLTIADTASINTHAFNGKSGQWLLDPNDFTIAASGGDITGTALATALGLGNVTIQTTGTTASCTGATCTTGTAGNGDIFVNDAVSWGSTSTLTLDAWRNIEVSQAISVTSNGGLTLKYGQQAVGSGNTASYLLSAPINLASGATFMTHLGSDDVAGTSYTIVNDRTALDTVASGTNYVLGADITAGAGAFTPISSFTSVFDGLGHTIDGLTITAATANNSGLFAEVGGFMQSGEVRNLGLTNVSVTGTASWMGGIAGTNWGSIHHSYVTGNVGSAGGAGTFQTLGGLVGLNNGSIASSYSGATVTGASGDADAVVGGLVGVNTATSGSGGSIADSYATGAVSKASGAFTGAIGGLVGSNEAGGAISNSYSSGSVSASGSSNMGGLVGMNGNNDVATGSTITNSYFNSTTSGQANGIGNDVAGTPQTVTAKTTTQLTASTVLTDLGLSSVIWLRDSTTGYPVLRGIVYSASGAPTVVYVRLTAGSSIYGSTPSLTWGYYDTASGGNAVSISPTGSISWLYNSAPITLSTTTNAGIYSLTYGSGLSLTNYSFSAGTAADWTINKADLTLSGSRAYNGSTSVAGSVLTATGVNGQTFTVTGGGDTTNLTSKNVQAGSLLATLTGLSLGSSNNGGLSGNYNALSTTGSSITITQAAITLSTSNVTKTYDGGLAAAGVAAVSSGTLFTGDTLSGGTFAFTDKNAGTGNKTVTATGITLNDGNAGGNYAISYVDNTTSTINKAALTVTANAVTKTYDGTLTATGTGTVGAIAGAGEAVLSAGSQAFLDKNAGTGNKTVRASGVTIKDAGNANVTSNYTISYVDDTASTINKANLTLSGSRIYDGTSIVAGSVLTATGVHGETFGVLGAGDMSNLGIKDVQTGSQLATLTGLSLGSSGNGGLSGNYNVLGTSGSSMTITQKALTILGLSAESLTGPTAGPINLYGIPALMGAVAPGAAGAAGVPYTVDGPLTFSGTAQGTNLTVTGSTFTGRVTGLALNGTGAANYTLTGSSVSGTIKASSAPPQLPPPPPPITTYTSITKLLADLSNGTVDGYRSSTVQYANNSVIATYKTTMEVVGGGASANVLAKRYARSIMSSLTLNCQSCVINISESTWESWLLGAGAF